MSKAFYEEFKAQSFIGQVDDLIRGNNSATEIARFVQDSLKQCVGVKFSRVRHAVLNRMDELSEKDDDVADDFLPGVEPQTLYPGDDDGKRKPRRMGAMSAQMYRVARGGVNAIIEVESAILMQRDRIDELVRVESETGQISETLHRDIETYRKLLLTHAELRKMLGFIGGAPQDAIKVSLDVQGIGESFGKGVAEAIANPQSRTKLLAIAKRMVAVASRTDEHAGGESGEGDEL